MDSEQLAMDEMARNEISVLKRRGTHEYIGPIALGGRGLPLNPRGSTGFTGRGKDEGYLKFGVNPVVDMMITRQDPETDEWQVVVLKEEGSMTSARRDQYRLPGARLKTAEDYELAPSAFMHCTFLEHVHGECRCKAKGVTFETGFGVTPRSKEFNLAKDVSHVEGRPHMRRAAPY